MRNPGCGRASYGICCLSTGKSSHLKGAGTVLAAVDADRFALSGRAGTVAIDGHAGQNPMNRRRFVRTAGILLAGSAFSRPLMGCGSSGLEIPCLGPAAAPEHVPGMTYIRASEIGCALDCDLETGRNKHTGGAATDDGPRINAAMAGATAGNPITLIIDGSALISGLFLPTGGYWGIAGLGCGTGFFVKSGTNNDGIHNGPPDAARPSDPGPPAPPRGKNVSLSNFTLNGNQGNGHDGDSTKGITQGSKTRWYFGIDLMNLDNIVIENVVVVNTPAYHIRLSNVGNVTVSGCVMKSHGPSTDGVHFDGPANDIAISDCQFATGDDSIALNCPEGYSGNISRVAVSNCTFNSWSLMRLYTTTGNGAAFTIDNVSVSNCTGTLVEAAFLIGMANGSLPHSIASLTVSDCSLTAPVVLAMAENFGSITLRNVIFHPSEVNVVWSSQPNHISAFMRPSPLYGSDPCAGSNLSFENCIISRNGNMDATAVILENGSVIENLSFNGFAVQDPVRYFPVQELLNLGGGTVGQLALNSVNPQNIRSLMEVQRYRRIASVSGTGVLATGWRFPNPVMANGVPYISAESGLPSIKVNGVVEPYPQS